MATPQKNSLIIGMDVDADELRIQQNKARFLKNMLHNVNRNESSSIGEGNNFGVLTPLESNTVITGSIVMPDGPNYCCGFKESEDTNEAFVFVYNDLGDHFIYCINGINGNCEVVFKGPELKFRYLPECFINETRCVVRIFTFKNKLTDIEEKKTFIIFTDGLEDQKFICKEDCIETNYLTGSYFIPRGVMIGQEQSARDNFIKLGVPQNMGCVGIERIPPTINDLLLPNHLVDRGWQFRIKFIYRHGREGEHGVISERFFISTGNSCLKNSSGISRCLKLRFDAGNPLVEKIQIEFRNCSNSNTIAIEDTGWSLYDVIDKYEYSTGAWYLRSINTGYTYTISTNEFEYIFCGDKQSRIIDPAETIRLANFLPKTSDAVFPLNQGIGLGNNVRDFEAVERSILENISFSVEAPTPGICDNIKPRKITVYAMLWHPYPGSNSRIWYNTDTKLYFFQTTIDQGPHGLSEKGQTFPKGITGFTGYLAGTAYVTISKQVVLYADDNSEASIDAFDASRPFVIVHKFEFIVLPGKYVFRIASHNIKPDENYQITSTFVGGTTLINPTLTNFGKLDNLKKEKIIDVCSNSMRDTTELLLIFDLVVDERGTVFGYVNEAEKSTVPVELARLSYVRTSSGDPNVCSFTDHNGFYFCQSYKLSGDLVFDLQVEVQDCVSSTPFLVVSGSGNENDYYYEQRNLHAYHVDDDFPEIGRRYFYGKIVDCDNALVGIPGIPIVLENGGWTRSDANGSFTIIAHQRYNVVAGAGNVTVDWRTIRDNIIISQGGICQIITCADCEMCFADFDYAYIACNGIKRETFLTSVAAKIRGENSAGPQNGGRYSLGISFHDWMGRSTFPESLDKHFIDIPSILEIKDYSFSKIRFDLDPGFSAPAWAKYMSFWITQNLNWEDSIMWAIDRATFVDSVGNENSPNPIKIRLYYESIAEYSSQNNFSVNSNWQFIDENNLVIQGDRIEFIQKPDGTWYDKIVSSLVRYNKSGKYVEIDYTEDLKDIENGTMIKIIRPKKLQENNIYYELCPIIRLNEGIPEVISGYFDYKDSYFVNRAIPVPFYTTSINDTTGETDIIRNVISKAYTYFYEHPSPSDFWGNHCKTLGRISVKNEYQREKRFSSELLLSKKLINKSNFNGLSYFDQADVVEFDEQEWGGITAVIVENNTVLVICERNNFVVSFNDTTLRLDSIGNVIGASSEGRFGKPLRKIGNDFGCRKRDINTIQKLNGIVAFLDTTNSKVVFHTFSDVEEISDGIGSKSWVERTVTSVNLAINDEAFKRNPFYIAGIDPKNKEYYLTKFFAFNFLGPRYPPGTPIPDDELPIFINNEKDHNLLLPETAVFNISKEGEKFFKGFVSFCPEYYGFLKDYFKDKNMFSFRNGEGWSHHEANSSGNYNNFYGIQCKKVIRIITNVSPEKEKRFLYNEVYCKEHPFMVDRVITESGQISNIPVLQFDRRDTFYTAPYLCATNTPVDAFLPKPTGVNKLLDGDLLYGRWASTRYISLDDDDDKYCEVSAIVCYVIAGEKSAD